MKIKPSAAFQDHRTESQVFRSSGIIDEMTCLKEEERLKKEKKKRKE